MQQRISFFNADNSLILNVLLNEKTTTHAYMKATEILDAGTISGAIGFTLFHVLEYKDILDN